MGDYSNQKSVTGPTTVQNVDVQELAKHLAQLLSKGISNISSPELDFNDSLSLEKLAKSMIMQREDKDSNFNKLGDVKIGKQTKEDQKDVQDTINLLNNIE